MAINRSGTLCATASDKVSNNSNFRVTFSVLQGTLIRLFETKSGEKWAEFRRGTQASNIEHLSFNEEGTLLTCTSDSSTVHIFKVPNSKEGDNGNTKSYFSMLSSVVSYAGSEWSFAQVKIDAAAGHKNNLSKTISTVHKGKVRILTQGGQYIVAPLTEQGGQLVLETTQDLFQLKEQQ